MNVDECRNRAERCLAAAQNASAEDVRQSWQQLAEMWVDWSEQLRRYNAYKRTTTAVESDVKPVIAAEPISESIISRNGKISEIADRLRSKLALR